MRISLESFQSRPSDDRDIFVPFRLEEFRQLHLDKLDEFFDPIKNVIDGIRKAADTVGIDF